MKNKKFYRKHKRKIFKVYKTIRQYMFCCYGGGKMQFKRKKYYTLKKMLFYLLLHDDV